MVWNFQKLIYGPPIINIVDDRQRYYGGLFQITTTNYLIHFRFPFFHKLFSFRLFFTFHKKQETNSLSSGLEKNRKSNEILLLISFLQCGMRKETTETK